MTTARAPNPGRLGARGSLATRMSLLAVAVVLVTAVVAGALGTGLIRQASSSAARTNLSRLADAAQTEIDDGTTSARARTLLATLNISTGVIEPGGAVRTANARLRQALRPDEIQAVLAGRRVSVRRAVTGREVLVEARPTAAGGIALLERTSDAQAGGDRAIRRLLLAIVIAAALAVLLGLAVAWQLARPLRRTAAAAHALAAGRRDVDIPVEGPAEVAEVGAALGALAASLSTSEARQREFLLAVSHDLRTPLTAITGYAESLADGVVTGAAAERAGGTILAESHRLNRLVADLLDLARLEAADFRIDVIEVDVTALLHEAGEVWATRCAAAELVFHLELPADPLRVRSDPVRIRQILDGLLENALRVTPAGRPIVLAARTESGGNGGIAAGASAVAIEVRDGGPGLSDADLSVAFDRSALYDRYRGVRQVGTGLGLAIVHRLSERLGAAVAAGHAPEGGARFTLLLPPAAPARLPA